MSKVQLSPLNVCMASSEAVPFAKTGGLADVVGALAVEFCRLGHDVNLLIPGYRQLLAAASHRKEVARLVVPTVSGMAKVGIHEISAGGESQPAGAGRLRIFAISHDASFDRAGLYQEGGLIIPTTLNGLVCSVER